MPKGQVSMQATVIKNCWNDYIKEWKIKYDRGTLLIICTVTLKKEVSGNCEKITVCVTSVFWHL